MSVPVELYELLAEKADLAGVSLSRYVFFVLRRKKIIIVPGINELVQELKAIAETFNTVHNPQLARAVVDKINNTIQAYDPTGSSYPLLEETNSGKYSVAQSPKKFSSLLE